jgi:hypothetical protein
MWTALWVVAVTGRTAAMLFSGRRIFLAMVAAVLLLSIGWTFARLMSTLDIVLSHSQTLIGEAHRNACTITPEWRRK